MFLRLLRPHIIQCIAAIHRLAAFFCSGNGGKAGMVRVTLRCILDNAGAGSEKPRQESAAHASVMRNRPGPKILFFQRDVTTARAQRIKELV